MSLHHMLRAAAGNSAGPSDPNFENVTLLLTGDGTNGAQNNTFLDSSTNNFTITRNGNTTQGSFSPYGNLWSNYFDGSGDYLTIQYNSALTMGNGDFTIECWYYQNAFTNDHLLLMQDDGSYDDQNFQFRVNSSGVFQYIFWTTSSRSSATTISGSTSVTLNTWNHLAVSYSASNTTTRLFLNGNQVGSSTSAPWNSSTYSGQTAIGNFTSGVNQTAANAKVNGYISNIRMIKGTALYTSNFTPSTTPLTAVSGTSLLTCQSNRFIDNSSNNFTLTVNGDTSVQRFSPFNPTAPYSAATIGGSGYFDGTGDYLTLPSNTAFGFGTGDFTIECWAFATSSGDRDLVTFSDDIQNVGIYLGNFYYFQGSGSLRNIGTAVLNQWNHIAISRKSGTVECYVNGVRGFTGSDTINTSTRVARIGTNYNGTTSYWSGYISSVRIIKGTGLYTGTTITVPTAPLTAITNTQLLTNFTNAGIPDAAMMNDLETVGNAQVSTSVKKYGTGSLYFDGTGDRLAIPSNPVIPFGTGDFTIEFWVYFNAVNNGTIKFFFDFRNAGATTAALIAQETNNTWTCNNGSGATLDTGWNSSTFTTGTWYHIAMCRSSSVTKFFVNGTQTSSVSDTGNYSNSTLSIAARYSNEYSLNGYIDDFRITKGYARYTANFTPPTAALPVY